MTEISAVDRTSILTAIRDLPSAMEDSSGFTVLKQYALLCNPHRYLILGGQGAGKTRIFNAITTADGYRKIIGERVLTNAPDVDNSNIVKGYCSSSIFPAASILDHYSTDKLAKSYWIGSLLIILSSLPDDGLFFTEILNRVLEDSSAFLSPESLLSPSQWINTVAQNFEQCIAVLDEFDQYLSQIDRWAIIAYDDLDRLTSSFKDLFPFIRSLLSFWFKQSRRWERLRCKIFLRSDLFESRYLNFLDASRIYDNTIVLEWSSSSLYQLLINEMLNLKVSIVLDYLNDIPGLIQQKGNYLGCIPSDNVNCLQEFSSRLIGKYVGGSPINWPSYHWFHDHLQDANGRLAPRSFIKCFSVAAQMMLEEGIDSLVGHQIILPSMLPAAIPAVSLDRYSELLVGFPWLDQLKDPFYGLTMLMDRDDFIDTIDMSLWDDRQKASLPEETPQGIFSVLKQIGVVFSCGNRVNVPELYLHAFHMKRKGRT